MTVSSVQQASTTSAAGTTSVTAILASGATAGNLLWCAYGGDKAAGTITPPSGYTQLVSSSSTSVSIWAGYKVATGGETQAIFGRSTTSTSGDTAWIGEFSEPGDGAWEVITTATHVTDESAVTSWASGTASDPGRACAGIAFFAIDSTSSASTSTSWSGSFTALRDWDGTGGVGYGDIAAGWDTGLTGGASVSVTYTHAPTADQVSAAIALFARQTGVTVTGTLTATVTTSGTVDTAATGTVSTGVGITGGLVLGAGVTGSMPIGVGITGGIAVTSRVFTGLLEVELDPVLHPDEWTDITDYVAFRSGALRVRQGRPSEYDDISAGTLTCALWNDDGRFMPGNTSSPIYPDWGIEKRIRWTVTKSGVSYTRFVGWIQSIQPEFPDASTNGAIVNITATDALGRLAQRTMRSNFTEMMLWRAREDSAAIDVYESTDKVVGGNATMTNYSTDTARSIGSYIYLSWDNVLSFGSDSDASIGGTVSCQAGPASTSKTTPIFRAGMLQIVAHLKSPSQVVESGAASQWPFSLFRSGTPYSVCICSLAYIYHSGKQGLYLYDGEADEGSSLGLIGDVPLGQFVKIVALSRVDNAAKSDWTVYMLDGTTSTLSNVAVDIRTAIYACFPALNGLQPSSGEGGGIAGIASRTTVSWRDSFVSAGGRSLATRVGQLGDVVEQLGITITTLGTLTGYVATGTWSGRSGMEILHEMMRTWDGIAWARPRDSALYAVASSYLYPASPAAVIDVDADCQGAPRLVQGAESQPSRVEVSWVGGTAVAVDTTLEAAGVVRRKTVATVAATHTQAQAVADAILARANGDLRISQVTVDLTTGATDHTAALFSESTDLGGLFPTQRIQLTVPATHFGTTTRNVYVQGWTEEYSPERVTIQMDTTPA